MNPSQFSQPSPVAPSVTPDDPASPDLEQLSAFMDGGCCNAQEAQQALHWALHDSQAREHWHLFHLVGDVLRSSDLARCTQDRAFVTRLGAELARQPQSAALPLAQPVSELTRIPSGAAANDSVFRWKMVAGLASCAAVAVMGWVAWGGWGGSQTAAPIMAHATPDADQIAQPAAASTWVAQATNRQLPATHGPASYVVQTSVPGGVMLRDARLDELLAAHRQATGTSALGNASGFLRNATFDGAPR